MSEIKTVLTTEQKQFFEKNGYVLVPQLLTEKLDICRDRIEEILAGERKHHHFVRFGEGGKPVFYRIPQLADRDEIFKAVAGHPAIMGAVRDLVGNAQVFRDILIGKPPKHGNSVVYHQDAAYWDVADPNKVVSAWIALDDAPSEAGCLRCIPGSHKAVVKHDIYFKGWRLPVWLSRALRRSVSLTGTGDNPQTLTQRSFWQLKDMILGKASKIMPSINDLNWLTIDRKTISNAGEIVVPARAGDVVIFHSLLLHASGPNTSPNSRRAYIVTYNADVS